MYNQPWANNSSRTAKSSPSWTTIIDQPLLIIVGHHIPIVATTKLGFLSMRNGFSLALFETTRAVAMAWFLASPRGGLSPWKDVGWLRGTEWSSVSSVKVGWSFLLIELSTQMVSSFLLIVLIHDESTIFVVFPMWPPIYQPCSNDFRALIHRQKSAW